MKIYSEMELGLSNQDSNMYIIAVELEYTGTLYSLQMHRSIQ